MTESSDNDGAGSGNSVLDLLPDDLLRRVLVSTAGYCGSLTDMLHFGTSCRRTHRALLGLLHNDPEGDHTAVLIRDLHHELGLPRPSPCQSLEQLHLYHALLRGGRSSGESRVGLLPGTRAGSLEVAPNRVVSANDDGDEIQNSRRRLELVARWKRCCPALTVTLASHCNKRTPYMSVVCCQIGCFVKRELTQLSQAYRNNRPVVATPTGGNSENQVAHQFWALTRDRNATESRAKLRRTIRLAAQMGVTMHVEVSGEGLMSQEEIRAIQEEEDSDDEDAGAPEEDWISVEVWGRRVADVAAESTHTYGALARQEEAAWVELYLDFGNDQHFPPRPEYYQSLEPISLIHRGTARDLL